MTSGSILYFVGKLYLRLRYRNRQQVERELAVKYDNKYSNAGMVLLFDLLMALAVVAVVGLIAVALYIATA
ncbi:hypothetical protein [Pontibacter vulgaris]|uniref:hypothetical protein n=1 Tax=Pontibacter vulgaris TaxID=2905679 RepID=UPI001FA7DDC9|nr:hypothetical protein [Pontibacter vulgaris]